MAGTLGEVLNHYTDITGRAPLPPRWALGYHQSRWGYKTEEDVRDVADNFKRMNIPLSAIHLDIDYMDGYKVFTIDRSRFPDMRALTDELAGQGIRIVTILDPAVKAVRSAVQNPPHNDFPSPESPPSNRGMRSAVQNPPHNDSTNIAGHGDASLYSGHDAAATAGPGADLITQYDLYEDGISGGHFCKNPRGEVQLGVVWPGKAAFPDFTNPLTRKWWGDKYKFFGSNGIAGVWHDMNEPTDIALLGDKTLPLDTIHGMDGRGGEHGEAHNLYALEMNRSGYAGLRKASPDKRPFILSRSGWAGSQRYAWGWTGDTESTWEALRQQIPTMIGLGLSGFPFSGPDIGGFNGAPSDELYLRWLQLSTFLPFCRTHSVAGVPLREPWKLPEFLRPYVAHYIRLRYRLLPYLYTLAHAASISGVPLVRPLGWSGDDGGNEPLLWRIDNAFMLGESMLVAPITAPGRTSRLVHLPKGIWSPWLDDRLDNRYLGGLRDTDEDVQSESYRSKRRGIDRPDQMKGGRVVRLPAPLENIPVLVRHGSILPLDDGWPQMPGRRSPASSQAKSSLGSRRSQTSGGVPDLEHRPKMPSFHIWPDERGFARGTCYDDCGDGYGESRIDDMTFTREGEVATVTWTREGSYPPPDEVYIVLHGMSASRCYADGKQIDIDEQKEPYHSLAVTCPPFSTLRIEGVALP
jgi:alpha-glucosidase